MAIQLVPFPPSRNIIGLQWDDETLTLVATFHTGAVYEYQQVPGDVVAGFREAFSATRYLREFVASTYIENRIV